MSVDRKFRVIAMLQEIAAMSKAEFKKRAKYGLKKYYLVGNVDTFDAALALGEKEIKENKPAELLMIKIEETDVTPLTWPRVKK